MELHSPTGGKKLWNILRIAFFMARKGFVSKRKLMLDMNLMMKRGKLIGKSLGNIMSLHHHHDHHNSSSNAAKSGHSFGLREYEFSCSNSPNPIFFRVNLRRKHSYFPCIGATPVDEMEYNAPPLVVLPRIGYSPKCPCDLSELVAGERRTPLSSSPFSVRVSNFSFADAGDGVSCEVDNQAEEFIKNFYQQLQSQGKIAMLEYQEEEFQEMLARGL